MDFEETAEEKAFRAEVRAWLEARAKRRQPGTDPEHFYSSSDTSAEADAAHVRACKAWQRTLYDAGWAAPGWPAGVVADGAEPGCGVVDPGAVDPGAVCGDGLLSSVWAWVCARCRSICGML